MSSHGSKKPYKNSGSLVTSIVKKERKCMTASGNGDHQLAGD
ncbi:hypothetical protein IMCC9480_3281 [Oxalobacteraceae bacterium IMCC9480]|nr:hypothetical protein IMCC9480_3281 [Oxalobacteraceae bacterium IMCC9480]